MEMTLRWYGSKFDTVTLKQIRQIPGVHGVITTLYDTAPGEVWSRERIRAMKDEVEAAGLTIAGIESVNIHDAIKTGAPERSLLFLTLYHESSRLSMVTLFKSLDWLLYTTTKIKIAPQI